MEWTPPDGIDVPKWRCWSTTWGRRPCQRLSQLVWISLRMHFTPMALMRVVRWCSAASWHAASCWISLRGTLDAQWHWRHAVANFEGAAVIRQRASLAAANQNPDSRAQRTIL